MKELIRSYYLSKLVNAPLSKQMTVLEEAILFIQNILNNTDIKTDNERWRDCEFYFIGDKYFFEYNTKKTYFYYRYDGFCSVLTKKYKYSITEINELLTVVVEEHFKSREVTPYQKNNTYLLGVEGHFKCMEVTPKFNKAYGSELVEEHFKSREVIPIRPISNIVTKAVEKRFK